MALDLSAVATELLAELASNADGYISLKRSSGGSVSPEGVYTPGNSDKHCGFCYFFGGQDRRG